MLAEKERLSRGWLVLVVSLQSIVTSSEVFCQPMGNLVGAWGTGELGDSHKARQGLLSPRREKREAALTDNPWHGGGTPAPPKGG